jgi:hypothetical protein
MNPGFIETTEKEIGEWKGVDKEEYETLITEQKM